MRRIFTATVFLLLFTQVDLRAQLNCAFAASKINGCPPLTVSFTDQSTGGATSYYWEFDNGNVSTLPNPSANYALPGIYNVMHVVSNGSVSDTEYLQIKVFQPANVNFIAPGRTGCNSPCYNVNFVNQTIPGQAPVLEYMWDFGDGSLPEPGYNISHCYNQTGTFTVTLVARDSNNCQSNKVMPAYIAIGSAPVADITATPVTSCNSPQTVDFTSNVTSTNGAVSYAWNFGNGNTSAQQSPSQVYSSGIYTPRLTVTDSWGCTDTASALVEITKVKAGFTASSINGCAGIPLQFTDTSNFASSWSWNFGDGTISSLQHPAHTYAANGTYNVTLTVTYGSCSDTKTQNAYINISSPVNFTLNADDTSQCTAPFTVNFTSNAPGATYYYWNFGDGSFDSTSAAPSHTYTTKGTFTVVLGVANSAGCIRQKTLDYNISVGALKAGFTVDSANGCSPMTVQFSNSTSSNVPVTNHNWQFGDGVTSTVVNPSHTYSLPGSYYPALIVRNAEGCRDTLVSPTPINVGQALSPDFSAAPLVQCVNQQIAFTNLTAGADSLTTYLWQFGDGHTDNVPNPVYFYSDTGYFTVTLTAFHQGCPDSIEKVDYLYIMVPRADFTYSFNCLNPTTVALRDTSIGADTWLWKFSDGTTSTQRHPVHVFPAEGTYTVTLVVSNLTTGCVDSMVQQIPVGTPRAAFTCDTVAGCYPFPVLFTDTSAFADSWLWKFGDGLTSTQKNPVHTYADTGRYSVTLIINPGGLCTDSVKKTNYITAYGIKTRLSAVPSTGCAPLTVVFIDSSRSFMGTISSVKWYFGTGDSAMTSTASYTYTTAPTLGYNARLRNTDNHGCTGASQRGIYPKKPVSDFKADTVFCPGEQVAFTNLSQGTPLTYTWFFGDGTTSTQINPTHIYTTTGAYSVTLVSKLPMGCTDTFTRVNYIAIDTPKADFYVASSFSPCPPFPVQFYNSTNRLDLKWLWRFGDGDTSTARDPRHVYKYPGNYSVTLTAWNPAGCNSTVSYTELIRIRGPVGNFSATPDTGCVPLTISTTGSVFSTVAVHADLGDGMAYDDVIDITHTYTTPGNYYPSYKLTDSLGCQVTYIVDTIVVGLIPYPNLPADTTVCAGNYVQFNLPLGDHFQWTADQPQTFLTCNDCRNPVSSSPDTITYYVVARTNIGCEAKDTITVNEDALPRIFPGVSYRICPSDTLQLHAGEGVSSATWSPSLYMNDSNLVSPLVYPPDTMIYRVTGRNSTGCSISRIVKVWTISKVVADVSVADTSICEGSPLQLTASVLQASVKDTSFRWTPPGYLSSPFGSAPWFNAPVGNYNYRVVVSSSTCVPDTNLIHVRVLSNPAAQAGESQTVAEGTSVQLWASAPGNVTYQWLPQADSLSCADCRRPFVTATANQTIPVVIVNESGCRDTAFVELRVVGCDDNMVFVPNTFSPNSDGLNDKLFVRGIGLNSLQFFRIFDRWGKLIFETEDIDQGWDGTSGGKHSPVATYVYLLKGVCSSGAEVTKSGNITLVR